jgi:hypothetical protein
MKLRYVFAALVLVGEAPILAALVAGSAISAVLLGASIGAARTAGWFKRAVSRARSWARERRIGRRPPRLGRAVRRS